MGIMYPGPMIVYLLPVDQHPDLLEVLELIRHLIRIIQRTTLEHQVLVIRDLCPHTVDHHRMAMVERTPVDRLVPMVDHHRMAMVERTPVDPLVHMMNHPIAMDLTPAELLLHRGLT